MKTTKRKKLTLAWIKTLREKKEDLIEAARYVAVGLILRGMLPPQDGERKNDNTNEADGHMDKRGRRPEGS